MRSLRNLGAALAMTCAAGSMVGAAQALPVDLAPHLAIYDLTLERAKPASGIEDFRGRLVFEAGGSACTGYSGETRFVGQVVSEQGGIVTDTRSTTFESADGRRFDFATERYSGQELVEETEGTARREGDEVAVELERPDETTFRLPAAVVFPSAHMRMILKAARAGERVVSTPVYDGSETGRIVYETTSVIGDKHEPMAAGEADDVSGNAAEVLAEWTSWPVTIAYFDPASETPDLPSYEFTYDLFANGISRAIRLDYGDFALKGRLVSLELSDVPPCDL